MRKLALAALILITFSLLVISPIAGHTAASWDLIYDGTTLPHDPSLGEDRWQVLGEGNPGSAFILSEPDGFGGYVLRLHRSSEGFAPSWHRGSEISSEALTLELRLKVVPDWSSSDNPKDFFPFSCEGFFSDSFGFWLQFHPHSLVYPAAFSSESYSVDFSSGYHVIRFLGKPNGTFSVFVDGNAIVRDSDIAVGCPCIGMSIEFGDDLGFRIMDSTPAIVVDSFPVDSYWDYIAYTTAGAFTPEELPSPYSPPPAVNIPDANLEAVIRDKLNKPEGPITDTELQSITELDAYGEDIADLTGLEYCTNLTGLYLWDNQISDISVLSNLTNLTDLYLSRNQIINISALSNLTNLTELDLAENQIIDINALSELINLTGLTLGWNQIINISALSNLTNLTELGLGENQIIDINALSKLTNLTGLTIVRNQISDLQPLIDNPGIDSGDKVYVSDNPLSYTSQKTHTPALEERGVDVNYYAKGTVSLDSAGPPTWSYTLTYGSSDPEEDAYIYNFFYEGAGITDASVTGEAEAAGWIVEYQDSKRITFANDTPLTEGSVSGFEITGIQGGTGSWLCGRNAGSIAGPLSYPPGDVSGNGYLSAYDSALIFQHISGLIELSEEQQNRGDVDEEVGISASDAELILKKVVGLIDDF